MLTLTSRSLRCLRSCTLAAATLSCAMALLPGLAVAARAGDHRSAGALADETCDEIVGDDGWTIGCGATPADALVSRTWTLTGLQTVNQVDKSCADVPGDTYRLMSSDLSPGRGVPRGVEVREPGGIGVTGGLMKDLDNFSQGVADLSMTNWSLADQDVTLVLHCTTDVTWWYRIFTTPM